jgi:hypothetical protein
MKFKEITPKLQLSFDEYVETWDSIAKEYYSRGLEADITDKELSLNDEEVMKYSMELGTVVLIIALRILNSKTRMSEDIRNKISNAVIEKFYSSLYGEASAELREEYMRFFRSQYDIFNKICLNLADKDAKKRQPELIGLARYIAAQISSRHEKENVKAIEQISLVFIDEAATCFRLAQNSAVDNQILGKIKFVVQK